jgi:hypothetical protein
MTRSLPRSLRFLATFAAAAPLSCLLLAGCHVTEADHGDHQNVSIGTPFGSMKVNTNKNGTDTASIGITAYPGATPVNDKNDDDSNNANVSMNFGPFHLGVKAADFQTSDPSDKIIAFYKKDLATRYGSVIECRGHNSVGSPDRTSQGLTCSDDEHTHIKTHDGKSKGFSISSGDSSADIELRSGSPQHLHIVGIENRDGGTKIGLVSLDLPSDLSDHDSKDSE